MKEHARVGPVAGQAVVVLGLTAFVVVAVVVAAVAVVVAARQEET